MATRQTLGIDLQVIFPVQLKGSLPGSPVLLKAAQKQSDMKSSSLPDIIKDKDKVFIGFQRSHHDVTKLPKLLQSKKASKKTNHNKTTQTFESPTLSQLVTELFDVSDKWRDLGTQLGLSQDAITSIEKNHSPYDDRCLINVLNIWLQSCDSPSWMVIVQALKSQSVSENGTAVRIYRDYLTL